MFELTFNFSFQMSVSPPSSNMEIYQNYIDKLQQLKEDNTLINTVYQRAITDCPLDTNLWKQYLKFLVNNNIILLYNNISRYRIPTFLVSSQLF